MLLIHRLVIFGYGLFTARKRSWGKVMFLHLSVILFTGEVVSASGPWGRGCNPETHTPVDTHTSPPWTHTPPAPGHVTGSNFEITFVSEKHVVEHDVLFTNHLVGK